MQNHPQRRGQTEAERIHKLVTSEGNDFAETAKKHSDGPSSTKVGICKFKLRSWQNRFPKPHSHWMWDRYLKLLKPISDFM